MNRQIPLSFAGLPAHCSLPNDDRPLGTLRRRDLEQGLLHISRRSTA
jgi:hypothetical protein